MMWFGNTLREALKAEWARQVPRLPSFKHTTAYNPDNDLIREPKPIEHVLLHPICALFHLMCACKHCNIMSPG